MNPLHPTRTHAAISGAVLVFCLAVSSVRGAVQVAVHNESLGVKCEAMSPFRGPPAWAFLPVELNMANASTKAHRWSLTTGYRSYGDSMSVSSGFSAVAEPGSRARAEGLVVVANNGNYSGYQLCQLARDGGSGSTGHNNIILENSSNRGALSLRSPLFASGGFGLGQAVDVASLPSDWRAYCGFEQIAITDAEWQTLTPGARTALREWTRLGGSLYISLAKEGPVPGLPSVDAGSNDKRCSFGIIEHLVASGSFSERLKAYDDANQPWAVTATDATTLRNWDAGNRITDQSNDRKIPGVMAVVVLAFAILAGPVNIFLLAPARRRHRLFFTTPLISLAAGVLLVLAVVLVDGVGGKGRRMVWLESVPEENTAYVQQHQASRCGAMFSTGFDIRENAYFAPMSTRSLRNGGSYSVNLQPNRVEAAGPWFSSRHAQAFYLAAARPGRSRLELGGAPDQPTLTSAFEFPIERCFFLAKDGTTWWQCPTLKPGVATPMSPASDAEVRNALEAAVSEAPKEQRDFMKRAMARPGYFVALSSAVPAIETHRRIKWQTSGIITGPAVTP